MLTPEEHDQLFMLLRKVRVARGDFASEDSAVIY
jgi:hypothetical protein